MIFTSREEFLELRKALEDLAANHCRWGYDLDAPWKLRCPNCRSSTIRLRKRYVTGKKWRCDHCKYEFDKPIDLTEGLLPFNPMGEAEPRPRTELLQVN